MRKALLLILCGLLFVLCNEPPIESIWRDKPIVIDGNASDWTNNIHGFSDAHFGIGIANDSQFLYLCLTTDNRSIAKRMMRFGCTIRFTGQKGHQFGIHFPCASGSTLPSRHNRNQDSNQEMSNEDNSFIESINQSIEIYDEDRKDMIPVKALIAESLGVFARIKPDKECCALELKMPINLSPVHGFALCPQNDSCLDVSIDVNAPEQAKKEESSSKSDDGMGGGAGGGVGHGGGMGGSGGGMGGGGHHGGGHGGGNGQGNGGHGNAAEDPDMTSSCSVEFNIILARQPLPAPVEQKK